jgi:hypothetical protein
MARWPLGIRRGGLHNAVELRTDGRFGGTPNDGVMNNEDFQALARQGALDALKALAAIAVDPTAVASDREHAQRMVELRLEQASNDIPVDLRREIENVLHKNR